jgi:hypothetical protein
MTNVLQNRSLLQEAFFQLNEQNWRKTVAKIVALNVFSFVVFFPLETIVFRYFFGMTLAESVQLRIVAAFFNTLTSIYWERIEDYFESKMSHLPQIKWKWLRSKIENLWQEVSLIIVKLLVNGKTYVIVGIMVGHLGSPTKLLIKIGVIVLISYLGADFLKYRITPFFEKLMFGEKEPVDPIFLVKTTAQIVVVEELEEEEKKEYEEA